MIMETGMEKCGAGSKGGFTNEQEESLGFYEVVKMENIKCSVILEATFLIPSEIALGQN